MARIAGLSRKGGWPHHDPHYPLSVKLLQLAGQLNSIQFFQTHSLLAFKSIHRDEILVRIRRRLVEVTPSFPRLPITSHKETIDFLMMKCHRNEALIPRIRTPQRGIIHKFILIDIASAKRQHRFKTPGCHAVKGPCGLAGARPSGRGCGRRNSGRRTRGRRG